MDPNRGDSHGKYMEDEMATGCRLAYILVPHSEYNCSLKYFK